MPEAAISAAYRMLGVDVELTSDRPGLLERFDRLYGNFRVRSAATPTAVSRLRLDLRADDDSLRPSVRVESDGQPPFLLRADDEDQLCLAAASLAYSVSPRIVLHAGALARDGDGIVICASSGTGKTTLVLELARRGLALLSDELAPVDPASGAIEPFPRAVGLRDGALAIHSWIDDDAGARARNAKGEFKRFVDPHRLPGVSLGAEVPVRHVVFLSPPRDLSIDPATSERFLEIRVATLSIAAEAELAALPEVASVRRLRDHESGVTARLGVRAASALSASLESWSQRSGSPIVAARWGAYSPPRFDREPELEPLSAAEGLPELANHLLNRRPPSRLLDAHGGSLNRLLLTLARASAGAHFWRLVVGDLGGMAERVEAL